MTSRTSGSSSTTRIRNVALGVAAGLGASGGLTCLSSGSDTQIEVPRPGFGLDIDFAFMPAHDAVDAAEAEPGAFVVLRGIKGLKAARFHLFAHADAVVFHGDDEPAALQLRFDRDRAALRNGVDGIEDQVHQHLAQFRLVARHRGHIAHLRANIDVHAFGERLVFPARWVMEIAWSTTSLITTGVKTSPSSR